MTSSPWRSPLRCLGGIRPTGALLGWLLSAALIGIGSILRTPRRPPRTQELILAALAIDLLGLTMSAPPILPNCCWRVVTGSASAASSRASPWWSPDSPTCASAAWRSHLPAATAGGLPLRRTGCQFTPARMAPIFAIGAASRPLSRAHRFRPAESVDYLRGGDNASPRVARASANRRVQVGRRARQAVRQHYGTFPRTARHDDQL